MKTFQAVSLHLCGEEWVVSTCAALHHLDLEMFDLITGLVTRIDDQLIRLFKGERKLQMLHSENGLPKGIFFARRARADADRVITATFEESNNVQSAYGKALDALDKTFIPFFTRVLLNPVEVTADLENARRERLSGSGRAPYPASTGIRHLGPSAVLAYGVSSMILRVSQVSIPGLLDPEKYTTNPLSYSRAVAVYSRDECLLFFSGILPAKGREGNNVCISDTIHDLLHLLQLTIDAGVTTEYVSFCGKGLSSVRGYHAFVTSAEVEEIAAKTLSGYLSNAVGEVFLSQLARDGACIEIEVLAELSPSRPHQSPCEDLLIGV